MYLRAVFVLCLSVGHLLLCHGNEQMDDSRDILESLSIDPNSVLDHEIVEINLPGKLHKRDLAAGVAVNVKTPKIDVNLVLVPVDSLFATDETKVYKAYHTPGSATGVTYKEVVGAMKDVGQILKDPKHLATMILEPGTSGKPTMTGHLVQGKTPVVIRPVPARVANKITKPRRSVGDDLDDDSENKTYHLVARLKGDFSPKRIARDLKMMSPQRNSRLPVKPISGPTVKNAQAKATVARPQAPRQTVPTQQKPQSQVPAQKAQRPKVLRPQVLVELDHSLAKILEKHGMRYLLQYVLAFWNGADMVYRNIDRPMIRLNMATIIIAMDAQATPFLAASMTVSGAVNVDKALDESTRYHFSIKDRFPFDSYDFASTMTALKMEDDNGPGPLGVAYVNGVCHDPRRTDSTTSVSLVYDNGGFFGILNAAHEVGHLFGLHHDDVKDPPGCGSILGYVMQHNTAAGYHKSWFSECSLAAFRKNYEEGEYECTYNVPRTPGKELPKFMPGKMEALDEQCRALGHEKSCIRDDEFNDICVQFWCEIFTKVFDCTKEEVRKEPGNPCNGHDNGIFTSTRCQAYGQGAAPGTPCGNHNETIPRYCVKGRCIAV